MIETSDNRDYMRALLAAYTEVTGIELDLDHDRRKTLRELDKKGLTPDDMRAVMRHIKALVESTDTRYTDSSLLFTNAVGSNGKVGKFQEWAQLLRKRKAKRASQPASAAPAKPSAEEEARIRAGAKRAMDDLKAKIRGGQG